jgi:arylsulfatase A-like enzyme
MHHLTDWDEADVSDKPQWVRDMDLPSPADCNMIWRRRIEAQLSVDEGVGTIMDKLAAAGVADNTHTPYFSDNGFMIGEHRWTGKVRLYDESMFIPLFWAGPGIATTGQTLTPFVNTADITATIVELAGATAGREADGRTLRPLFRGETPSWWKTVAYCGYGKAQGVRTADYMYAETNDEHGFFQELYDLSRDSCQMRNVIGEPGYDRITEKLRVELDIQRTGKGRQLWRTTRFPKPPVA